jgi:hypothetical protein
MNKKMLMMLCIMWVGVWLSGCAALEPAKPPPYKLSSTGTVIWEDEFEFMPPSPDWKLLRGEEDAVNDINFGFMREDRGGFPSVTVFAYDEDPFGCSPQFEGREKEFFKRFLFNAILQFQILEKKKIEVVGREGLQVDVEGKDPVKGEKVRARVIFGKRGDRVVGFYITQWRPIDGTYDFSSFEVFDRFVKSFKYLKKSFYETL